MTDLAKLDTQAPPGAFSTFDMMVLVPEVEAIPKKGFYVEVGVDKGKSLWIARQVARKCVRVIGVDLRDDPGITNTIFWQQDSKLGPPEGIAINVLFIDGDHTYEGCKADIEAWYPHMAKGGVMLFHDCDATSPGVVQSVKEFVKKHKFKDVYYDPNQQCSMARIRLP